MISRASLHLRVGDRVVYLNRVTIGGDWSVNVIEPGTRWTVNSSNQRETKMGCIELGLLAVTFRFPTKRFYDLFCQPVQDIISVNGQGVE